MRIGELELAQVFEVTENWVVFVEALADPRPGSMTIFSREMPGRCDSSEAHFEFGEEERDDFIRRERRWF